MRLSFDGCGEFDQPYVQSKCYSANCAPARYQLRAFKSSDACDGDACAECQIFLG